MRDEIQCVQRNMVTLLHTTNLEICCGIFNEKNSIKSFIYKSKRVKNELYIYLIINNIGTKDIFIFNIRERCIFECLFHIKVGHMPLKGILLSVSMGFFYALKFHRLHIKTERNQFFLCNNGNNVLHFFLSFFVLPITSNLLY